MLAAHIYRTKRQRDLVSWSANPPETQRRRSTRFDVGRKKQLLPNSRIFASSRRSPARGLEK
jgi:hypothetical protein